MSMGGGEGATAMIDELTDSIRWPFSPPSSPQEAEACKRLPQAALCRDVLFRGRCARCHAHVAARLPKPDPEVASPRLVE